jgi:hypothetical protein
MQYKISAIPSTAEEAIGSSQFNNHKPETMPGATAK